MDDTNQVALIKARAGKGAYAQTKLREALCPRCGLVELQKERWFRIRSRQIPDVEICQECNVDELIGPNDGYLPPEKWAVIEFPDGVPMVDPNVELKTYAGKNADDRYKRKT